MKISDIKIIRINSETVLARADIHFEDFTLVGFKIIVNPLNGLKYVTPPSYSSKYGWRKLFKTDIPDDWNMICERVLAEFAKFENDELSIDDIPEDLGQ